LGSQTTMSRLSTKHNKKQRVHCSYGHNIGGVSKRSLTRKYRLKFFDSIAKG
jgi:hypothetical protein